MRFKVIILMLLVVLFTIFVSQNTQVVNVNLFFWRVELSAIVLITLTGLLGIILGFILTRIFDKPQKQNPIEENLDQQEEAEK